MARFQKGKWTLQINSRCWEYFFFFALTSYIKQLDSLVLLCCYCVSLEMMSLFAGQVLGITFPAVMDLPVHSLWPCHLSLIMCICQPAAGAQWVVLIHVGQRGPVENNPMIAASLSQGLLDWSEPDPGLRDGARDFTWPPYSRQPPSEHELLCQDQCYLPLVYHGFLPLSL